MDLWKLLHWPKRERSPSAGEQQLLDSFIAALPTSMGKTVRDQVRAINLVQRHANGREVNLYHMRSGRPAPDDVGPVENLAEEHTLGRVTFRLGGAKKVHTAGVVFVSGRLFSLDLDTGIGDNALVSVVDVELFLARHEAKQQPDGVRGPSWLIQLEADYPDLLRAEPLTPESLRDALRSAPPVLPRDYREMLTVCDGFVVGPVLVLGARGIRRVALDDQLEFWMLAECKDSEALGVMTNTGEALVIADYSGEKVKPTSLDLESVIRVWLTDARVSDA